MFVLSLYIYTQYDEIATLNLISLLWISDGNAGRAGAAEAQVAGTERGVGGSV